MASLANTTRQVNTNLWARIFLHTGRVINGTRKSALPKIGTLRKLDCHRRTAEEVHIELLISLLKTSRLSLRCSVAVEGALSVWPLRYASSGWNLLHEHFLDWHQD